MKAQKIGTGNGVLTQFQLVKEYVSSATTISRNIKKPVAGTLKIFLNGVEKTSGVNLDSATGLVTLTPAPASGVIITADFEFDVPVRFDTDRLSASLDNYGVNSWNNIPIVEVR